MGRRWQVLCHFLCLTLSLQLPFNLFKPDSPPTCLQEPSPTSTGRDAPRPAADRLPCASILGPGRRGIKVPEITLELPPFRDDRPFPPPTRRNGPVLPSRRSMGSMESVRRVLVHFVFSWGAVCVGFSGSLPLGSCRSSPISALVPCVLNPLPAAAERPATIVCVCGHNTMKGGILTGRSILFGRPRLLLTPFRFFFSERHSSLHRLKLTSLQEYHAERPRGGPDSADLGPDKRCTRQTSLIASSHVIQRVHDGNRRRNIEAEGSSTPRHAVFGRKSGETQPTLAWDHEKTYNVENMGEGHAADVLGADVKVVKKTFYFEKSRKRQPTA